MKCDSANQNFSTHKLIQVNRAVKNMRTSAQIVPTATSCLRAFVTSVTVAPYKFKAMNPTLRRYIILAFVAALAICFMWSRKRNPTGSSGKVTIADGTQPIAAPVYIAYAKGYFKAEGLDVELVSFPTGKLCLDALIGGKADFATVSETPITFAAFKTIPIKIVTTMHRSRQNTFCVARKDHGINRVLDLKGKTVAVPIGTNAQYGLAALVSLDGFSLADLHLINLSPPEMIGPITRGDVDAVVAWQPHALRCERALGDNGLRLTFEHVYEETYNIITGSDMTKQEPQKIVKLLKALNHAIDYIEQNRDESINIVAQRIGMQESELKDLWPIYHFGLDLRLSLVNTLNSEAKWAVDSGQANNPVPDMKGLVFSASLRSIKPDAVEETP